MLKRIIKEPLVQFFLIGGILYGIYAWMHPYDAQSSSQNIIINKQVLRNIINVNSKQRLSEQQVDNIINSLDKQSLDKLITDYVRDEALYQEAMNMGLDKNDFVIKRRLIQKLMFVIEDLNTQNINVSDKELLAYYQKHKKEYINAPQITFTHVYLSADKHGNSIKSDANKVLEKLNSSALTHEQAKTLGDVFPMQSQYGDASPSQVSAHFGKQFSQKLYELAPSNQWQGPIASSYGMHIVKIHNKKPATQASFDEIKEQLKQHSVYDKLKQRNEKLMQRIVSKYKVLNQLEKTQREKTD